MRGVRRLFQDDLAAGQFVPEVGVELRSAGEVGPLALGARVHYVHGEDLELNRLLVSEDLDGAVTLGAVARQVLRERREHSAAGHVVPVNDDERAHGSLRTPGVDAGSAPCGFLAVGVVREIEVERFRPALYNRGIDGRARHAHLCDGRSQARVRASTSPEIWMSDRPPTFSLPPMTSMGTLSTPSASGGLLGREKPSALSSCATASAHATKATMPVTAPNRSGATPVTAPAIAEVASLDLVIVAAHVEFETIRLGKQHDGRAGQAGSVRQHRYCSRAVLPAGGLQA